METQKSGDMSESDQMSAYILARISMIEATLTLLWNDHPNRAAVKASAALICEARETKGLNSSTSETALAIEALGRQAAFDAIFHELHPASGDALSRKV